MNHNFKIGDIVKLKTDDTILFSVIRLSKPKDTNNLLDDIREGVYDENYLIIRRYEKDNDNFNYHEVHHNEIILS